MERRIDFGSSHWLDVYEPSPSELAALAQKYSLPENLIRDCLDPELLPKFQRTPTGGLLMLRAFDENSPRQATGVQETTRKVALFWGENFLLSVHRVKLPWLEDIRQAWERGPSKDPAKLTAVLNDIIEECLFTYDEPIDQANVVIDDLEDAIFRDSSTSAPAHILETALVVKKRATLFKRMLRLTRDLLPIISKLGEPNSAAVQTLKEEADRLFFYADDLVETTSDLVQLSISLSANRTSDVVRLLTVVSIFILPLNLVTGIYGMNFVNMPEIQASWGYPAAIGLMFAIEVGLFLWLKHKRWLN